MRVHIIFKLLPIVLLYVPYLPRVLYLGVLVLIPKEMSAGIINRRIILFNVAQHFKTFFLHAVLLRISDTYRIVYTANLVKCEINAGISTMALAQRVQNRLNYAYSYNEVIYTLILYKLYKERL